MFLKDAGEGYGKVMSYCNSDIPNVLPRSNSASPKSPSPQRGQQPKSPERPPAGGGGSPGKKLARRAALVDCETGEFLDTYPNLSMMNKRMRFYDRDGQKLPSDGYFDVSQPDVSQARKIWEVYLSKDSLAKGAKKRRFKAFWVMVASVKFMYQDVSFVELENGWNNGAQGGGRRGQAWTWRRSLRR